MNYKLFSTGSFRSIHFMRNLTTLKMPQNMEIKARVKSIELVQNICKQYNNEGYKSVLLHQEDRYFCSPLGRLKLRLENGTACLIGYQREDTADPKESVYVKCDVSDPEAITSLLTLSNGFRGTIRKTRLVTLIEMNSIPVRIHLDDVESLGHFIEFEVCMPDSTSDTLWKAQDVVGLLTKKFQIDNEDLITHGYMDMKIKGYTEHLST